MKIELLPYGKGKSVAIEAAHIYTDEIPSSEHFTGAMYAASISSALKAMGTTPEHLLFIDDYNPQFRSQPEKLDLHSYIINLKCLGFPPSKVLYESHFTTAAQEIIATLEKKGLTATDQDGKVTLTPFNTWLYDPSLNKYSCPLLDASLSLLKNEQYDASITIVPKKFKKEQREVAKILHALGVDTSSMFQAYHDNTKPVVVYPHQLKKIASPSTFIQTAISLASMLWEFTNGEPPSLEEILHA